jgi:hypothetical protein
VHFFTFLFSTEAKESTGRSQRKAELALYKLEDSLSFSSRSSVANKYITLDQVSLMPACRPYRFSIIVIGPSFHRLC